MYDAIQKTVAGGGQAVILVPEQYTLETEKTAMHYLNRAGVMNVEVSSISRLMHRILGELGGSDSVYVNAEGRNMLIASILAGEKNQLATYSRYANVASFINALGDNISQMKAMKTDPIRLGEIANTLESGKKMILSGKLNDIQKVYAAYEMRLSAGLKDSHDEMELFISKICHSEFVRNTHFFVAYFDILLPQEIALLGELMQYGAGLTLYFSCGDKSNSAYIFDIVKSSMAALRALARECAVDCTQVRIEEVFGETGAYKRKLSSGIAHLERELHALPYLRADAANSEGITLVHASTIHSETESAAAYIKRLVRDKGLRYREIAVMIPDLNTRGMILKSSLVENGIPSFLDQNVQVRNNPALLFIKALLKMSFQGKKPELLIELAKTGFSPVSLAHAELLEEYCSKYKINRARFAEPFEIGANEYGETLAKIEEIRSTLNAYADKFLAAFKESRKVKDRLVALYDFLNRDAKMQNKLARIVETERRAGNHEKAIEVTQIWEGIVGIFDQMAELAGDEKLGAEMFSNIMASGFDSISIGVIPPTVDCVLIGDIKRTHFGRIRALVVLGMDEQSFPPEVEKNKLFSEDELVLLRSAGVEIGLEHTKQRDKYELDIYRILTSPDEYLYMSYAASDVEGNSLSPSRTFNTVCDIFREIKPEKDILSTNDPHNLVQHHMSAFGHLAKMLRDGKDGGEVSQEWLGIAAWYEANRPDDYRLLRRMIDSRSLHNLKITKDLARKLYAGERLRFSPSGLEIFGGCPFKFFVRYGLRPDSWETYEFGRREIGDIFHDLLRHVADELTDSDIPVSSEKSPWANVSREELRGICDAYIDSSCLKYKEGLITYGEDGAYRRSRLKKDAFAVVQAMVETVCQSEINKMACEEKFGCGYDIGALEIISGHECEENPGIEGTIDRIDYNKDGSYAITDYKTGDPTFSLTEMLGGRQLQLMLYSKAVERATGLSPAALNYVLIDEITHGELDWKSMTEEALEESCESMLKKVLKLKGIHVAESDEAGGDSDESLIELVERENSGAVNKSYRNLSRKQFNELNSAMDGIIRDMCSRIDSGDVGIRPSIHRENSSCNYCEFKSVCMFEKGPGGYPPEDIYKRVKEKLK